MLKSKLEPKWVTSELILHLLQKSRTDPSRIKWVRNAKRWRKWYRGETFLAATKDFDDTEIDERHATARRNIIGEVVDEVSSLFLKNAPIVRRLPFVPHHATLSDGLDALWIWSWDESYGQEVFRSIMEDSEITGLGAGKVFWDSRKSNRHYPGMVAMKQVPGVALYIDPDTTNDHRAQDPKFIIQHMRRHPEELVARYGDDAAIALGWRSAIGRKRKDWSDVISMFGMNTEELAQKSQPSKMKKNDGRQSGSNEKVDLYEAWLFPNQMYEAELTSEDKVTEDYRFGIVATMIRDKVIRVRPNPFTKNTRILLNNEDGTQTSRSSHIGHGTHPFVFLHWRPVADEEGNRRFYDVMGMVEWMVSMQFNVNALRRNMAIIMRTLANPVVAFNEDALATPPNKVVYAPGQMLRVRGQYRLEDAIKILTPAQMPNQVPMMIAEDMQGIREAGGVKPGVTGLFPAPGGGTSHTPAQTIGTLQEAAFVPLWKYVMQVGYSLQHLSFLYDGIIQQFFTPGHYMGTDRKGDEVYIDWTGDHRAAQFRRIVVAGATTPLYDLEREQREGAVLEMTMQALTSGDPRVMRAIIVYLDNLRFPWAFQYMQLIQEELQRSLQMTQGMQELGMAGMEQAGQPAPPAPGGTQDMGVQNIAGELGISPEELMIAASQ